MSRLSRATLAQAHRGDGVQLPPPGGADRRVGVLHLGIGAFHRAHQAVFTADAMVADGSDDWAISAVTQRSATVVEQLRPQDNLYAVLCRGTDATTVRVVDSVDEVMFAREAPQALCERFADPCVRVVTLTVTEKGYRRAGGGGLDLADEQVRADLGGGAPVTAVGQLVRGLQARSRTSGAPLTVLPCDNLTANGQVVHRLVMDFCGALPGPEGEELTGWVEANVRFPSSMVDRIVPATTPEDRELAARLLGLRDEGLVVAEPFKQWVIEDDFAADRPAWHLAGAQLTDDVAPFEAMKLRVLNGTHSMLAYLGALRGHETIAEAVRDEELHEEARRLITQDVLPTLDPPPGTDLAAYGEEVLRRFANPALRHRTVQVAMDGSQKLPLRLLGTVRDRLDAGATPQWATRAVAAWMVYVALGKDCDGRPLPLDDPLAARLRSATGGSQAAEPVVSGLLGVREVFGTDLPERQDWREALIAQVADLLGELGGRNGR